MRALVLLLTGLVLVQAQTSPSAPAQEIKTIAEKAYAFAYPLVLMEFTRRAANQTNQFVHLAEFPDAKFRQVVRPNADTLYSSAWLDLSKEPVLLLVPDTGGRYYLMHFMDAWTETFSVPGKRTTGTSEGWFAVVGPGWRGTLPERARRIDAPTNMVWLIGRTQTNSASDYENVHAIQKGYRLMPLSLYPDGARPTGSPVRQVARLVPPPARVQELSATEFFSTFADLLAKNPPHGEDTAMLRELERIGIAPGRPFRPEQLDADAKQALEEGARAMSKRLVEFDGRAGRWTGFGAKVGRYGTDYIARAFVARVGLGALPPEDAIYMNCQQDAAGRPLDGSRRYKMHFAKDQIPPVRAFWSVTMYNEDGYFVANPVNRYAIGDRDALQFNSDGSLDLYVQHRAPGGDRDRNWLPAPEGKFNLTLRLYWSGEEILTGRWTPPPLVEEAGEARN